MDTEEEADHEVDLDVGIGHTVNLFSQEEEAEVLLSPNNETIPLNRFNIQRQQIIQQHPSSPVISTKQQQQTQQVVQYHKNFTSNQHYVVPQDGTLPGGRLTHF